jgi:SAM-dependent methyltransferase
MTTQYTKKTAQKFLDFKQTSFDWRYVEKPIIQKCLTPVIKPTTKILEIGCGVGVATQLLIELGAKPQNIVCNDISQEMIDLAREHLTGPTFICEDAAKLKLPAQEFDLVFSGMTLHYLTNLDTTILFGQVGTTLKPGGMFFFVTDHPMRFDEHYRSYFVDEQLEIASPWGKLKIYPKTIEAHVTPLLENGFKILGFYEPMAIDEGKVADEKSYRNYSTYPVRLAILAVKER